jgi:hypothetical protein
MSHAVTVAINLDKEMLGRHGVSIAPGWVANRDLPKCTDLVAELGGRHLIKYIRSDDLNKFSKLSRVKYFSGEHYLTPTVVCRPELPEVLALPPYKVPDYALFLDPAKLDAVGPRHVRGGSGIEYVLLDGFSVDAIVEPGWAVKIG